MTRPKKGVQQCEQKLTSRNVQLNRQSYSWQFPLTGKTTIESFLSTHTCNVYQSLWLLKDELQYKRIKYASTWWRSQHMFFSPSVNHNLSILDLRQFHPKEQNNTVNTNKQRMQDQLNQTIKEVRQEAEEVIETVISSTYHNLQCCHELFSFTIILLIIYNENWQ